MPRRRSKYSHPRCHPPMEITMSQRMAEAATPILPFCIRSPNCNTHAVLAAAKFLASAGAGATLRVGWWPMTRPDEVFPVDSPKDRRPWPNCNQLFCAVDSQRATRDPAPGRGEIPPHRHYARWPGGSRGKLHRTPKLLSHARRCERLQRRSTAIRRRSTHPASVRYFTFCGFVGC